MIDTVTLNDKREMPRFGFGTWELSEQAAEGLCDTAYAAGYRLFDTASAYHNEHAVGLAAAKADDIWLTSKLWNADQGYVRTPKAVAESVRRLGCVPDLFLIHWPCPDKHLAVETWIALVDLRDQGKLKSIGVSNFLPEHIDALVAKTGVRPAVNQIELHPAFQQRDLVAYHRDHGIVTQSWSPLGQGKILADPGIVGVADRAGCSAAQAILAWHLAKGLCPIPKSTSPERIAQNWAAQEVTLSEDDIAVLDALDRPDGRTGPDPLRFG